MALAGAVEVEKQKEPHWVDARWAQTTLGAFQASSLDLPGGAVAKALSIRLGENDAAAVAYDTATCGWRAGWTGGFLQFDGARYGLMHKPKPAGEIAASVPGGPAWSGQAQWQGLHVNGSRVVLRYLVDGAEVLESPSVQVRDGVTAFVRSFTFAPRKTDAEVCVTADAQTSVIAIGGSIVEREGRKYVRFSASEGERVATVLVGVGTVAMPQRQEDVRTLAQPAAPRWQALTTRGTLGTGSGAYLVDTLTVPYDNPWKALFFCAGIGFLENGDAAVCTIHGDVWLVSGIDEKLERLTWRRFATGLYQPLGLVVVKNQIHVLGRDQITLLRDHNGDGEADEYACFTQAIHTSLGGHDYATSLCVDEHGAFYYVDPRGAHRISPDGRTHETLATGWRNPNGMGVGPGGLITVAPQEGNWTPASHIDVVKPGGYYGFGGPKVTPERPLGYDLPLCWLPKAVDNSTGSQVWPSDPRFGPLAGQMLNLSYGRCAMQLVLREEVEGVAQGGVVPLAPRFLAGVMRGATNPRDGQLYLAGSLGWQTAATKDGCLQRVRYAGGKLHVPMALRTAADGIELRFTEPLDPATAADVGSYAAERWNYRYAQSYGSKDYSVANPEKTGRDPVEIKAARLTDPRTVFLEIRDLRPAMQMHFEWNLNAADGTPVRGALYSTVHRVPPSQ
jgi:glucose/arabinose dehydrogenase